MADSRSAQLAGPFPSFLPPNSLSVYDYFAHYFITWYIFSLKAGYTALDRQSAEETVSPSPPAVTKPPFYRIVSSIQMQPPTSRFRHSPVMSSRKMDPMVRCFNNNNNNTNILYSDVHYVSQRFTDRSIVKSIK